MKGVVGVRMIGRKRRHGTNDTKIIRARADMGEEVANGKPAFAVALEFPRTLEEVAVIVEDGCVDFESGRLPIFFCELRFWVEAVDLGNPAIHVEENDAARFGGEVGRFRVERGPGASKVLLHNARQGQRAEAHGAFLQKFSSCCHLV